MIDAMVRWEPNARGRLEQAAIELYLERGFEQTTVADIAARAGLTERTFFRYYADKREVLFWGTATLQEMMVGAVRSAPASASALAAMAAGLEAAEAAFSPERRAYARRRQTIIAANPELQERELIKLATLGAAMAQGLRDRGVAEPAATLTAEAGIAVFRNAFTRWLEDESGSSFSEMVRELLAELKAAIA